MPDLAALVSGSPEVEIDLVVPWDSLVDVIHARRIANFASARVFALNSANHAFLIDLHRAGDSTPSLSRTGRRWRSSRGWTHGSVATTSDESRAVLAGIRGDWHMARAPRGPRAPCMALQRQGRLEEAQAAALLAAELRREGNRG